MTFKSVVFNFLARAAPSWLHSSRLMKQIDEVKEEHSNTTDPEKKEALRKEIMSLELKRDLLLESM
ncbi:hypothetical protein PD716_14815 [Vibrio gigantis]|uniref:hypothetical protein n=1 Tax=Vibrio gigantis TaxID=296199 RepID=UPI002FCAF410